MVSVGIKSLTQAADGRVAIEYTDGSGVEYPSMEGLEGRLTTVEDAEFAKLIAVSWWRRRDENFSNPNLIKNKVCTIDLDSPQVVKVQ